MPLSSAARRNVSSVSAISASGSLGTIAQASLPASMLTTSTRSPMSSEAFLESDLVRLVARGDQQGVGLVSSQVDHFVSGLLCGVPVPQCLIGIVPLGT